MQEKINKSISYFSILKSSTNILNVLNVIPFRNTTQDNYVKVSYRSKSSKANSCFHYTSGKFS